MVDFNLEYDDKYGWYILKIMIYDGYTKVVIENIHHNELEALRRKINEKLGEPE